MIEADAGMRHEMQNLCEPGQTTVRTAAQAAGKRLGGRQLNYVIMCGEKKNEK